MLKLIEPTDGTSLSGPHNQESTDRINAAITDINESGDHTGYSPQAELILSAQPTANDTIDIGVDVYEFDGAAANINVAIGADAAETRVNLVAAINVGPGLEKTFAKDDVANTLVRVFEAEERGGAPLIGAGSGIVLAEAIIAAADVWTQATLSSIGGQVRATKSASGAFAADATNLANPFQIEFPFEVSFVSFKAVTAAGIEKDVTATVVASGNLVTFDLAAGGAPLVATDTLVFTAFGE